MEYKPPKMSIAETYNEIKEFMSEKNTWLALRFSADIKNNHKIILQSERMVGQAILTDITKSQFHRIIRGYDEKEQICPICMEARSLMNFMECCQNTLCIRCIYQVQCDSKKCPFCRSSVGDVLFEYLHLDPSVPIEEIMYNDNSSNFDEEE